jgi:hypothetical protein
MVRPLTWRWRPRAWHRERALGIAHKLLAGVAERYREEALIDTGYMCRRCKRLLASGARCPTHRRAVLGQQFRVPWWVHNRRHGLKAA